MTTRLLTTKHPFRVDVACWQAWRHALPSSALWQPPDNADESQAPAAALPPFVILQAALDAAVEPLVSLGADFDFMRVMVDHIDIVVHATVSLGAQVMVGSTLRHRVAHPLGIAAVVDVRVECDDHAVTAGGPARDGGRPSRVCDVAVTFIARAPRRRAGWRPEHDGERPKAGDDDVAAEAIPTPLWAEPLVLPTGAPAAFSHALGVSDPVFVDDDVAKMAGLPAALVPLGGAVALVWDAILRRESSGARSLRRLCVWPREPLLGGDRLLLQAASHGAAEKGAAITLAVELVAEPEALSSASAEASSASSSRSSATVGEAWLYAVAELS